MTRRRWKESDGQLVLERPSRRYRFVPFNFLGNGAESFKFGEKTVKKETSNGKAKT